MRNKVVFFILGAMVIAGVAIAHEFPSDYDEAKEVCASSLMLSEGNWVTVRHLALHWRPGIHQSITGGRFVDTDFFGEYNWYRKWGTAEFPVDVELDGKKLPKGSYTIFLKSPKSDPAGLLLEFKSGDTVVDLKLASERKAGAEHDHLDVSVVPVGESGGFQIVFRYGPFVNVFGGKVN